MNYFETNAISENASINQVHICLVITGATVDPDKITEALKIKPLKKFRKGDPYQSRSGKKMIKPTGHWSFSTKNLLVSNNPEVHAQYLLEKFYGKINTLKSLDINHNIAISIWCDVVSYIGGFSLSSGTAKKLGKMCNRIDFRFFYISDEYED